MVTVNFIYKVFLYAESGAEARGGPNDTCGVTRAEVISGVLKDAEFAKHCGVFQTEEGRDCHSRREQACLGEQGRSTEKGGERESQTGSTCQHRAQRGAQTQEP